MKSYERQFIDLSATNVHRKDAKYLRLRILVDTHTIEKGLCHKEYKAGFGKATVIELSKMLSQYIVQPNHDLFAVENAISVLHEYHNSNQRYGFDDSDYLVFPKFEQLLTIHGGTKKICLNSSLRNTFKSFKDFSFSRVSVRMFDFPAEPIEIEEIKKCVAIAQNAPSACNRQAVRVHVVTDKSKFSSIERLQLGCKGFAQNASAFIFISNDLSLYESGEYKLPIFDAGIFTMNLVYSLLEHGIFSCILNASFPNDTNHEIYRLAGIHGNESINGLIAISRLSIPTELRVPVSARRSTEEICSFVVESSADE